MASPNKMEQPQAIAIDFDVAATMRDGMVRRANNEGEKR
jgi:hypothetical protein